MKIIVLDGFTLNPGDLSWNALEQLGELTVYDRTPVEQVVERCAGATVVFTNKVPVTAVAMQALPELKFIGVLATGHNIVDIVAAKQQGITVSNVPGYSTASVVQLAFGLLLELTHHVQRHSDAVFSGKWSQSKDFSFHDFPLRELEGKTMGIIGYGSIGKQVGAVAKAFGMKVVAASSTRAAMNNDVERLPLNGLLQQSDVVSLHSPLTPETDGLINARTLALMKPSAFLINTSRGPLIVEEDLANALSKGVIAGAGLDVLSKEPPDAHNPLFKAPNCIITPHIAWASKEARERLMDLTVKNLQAFLNGQPVNAVNP